MKVINLSEIVGARKVLTGLLGKRTYPKLVEQLSRQDKPQPLFINFNGLIASGSFFSQAILPLRDYSISQRLNLYPVIANIEEETLEELQWLFEMSPDAVFVCNLQNSGKVSNTRWVGVLEEKQQITFEAVLKEEMTDATTLSKKYESENISITGWNNRLSSLVAKSLIMELKRGRGKSYIPVLKLETN